MSRGLGDVYKRQTLAGVAAINGIPEAIGAGIITPLLAKALFAATPLKPE